MLSESCAVASPVATKKMKSASAAANTFRGSTQQLVIPIISPQFMFLTTLAHDTVHESMLVGGQIPGVVRRRG